MQMPSNSLKVLQIDLALLRNSYLYRKVSNVVTRNEELSTVLDREGQIKEIKRQLSIANAQMQIVILT